MRLWVIQNSFNFLFTFVAASLLLRLLSGLDLALQSFFQVTWELVSWNFSNFFWVILSLLCGLLASNSSAAPKFVGCPPPSVSFLGNQAELVSECIPFVLFTRVIEGPATLAPCAPVPKSLGFFCKCLFYLLLLVVQQFLWNCFDFEFTIVVLLVL